MKLSQIRNWKLLGLIALAVMVAVPVAIALQGTSQPTPPAQTNASQNVQQEDEPGQPSVDDADQMYAFSDTEDEDLSQNADTDEETIAYAFALDQQAMPMMAQATAEQQKLVEQNHLLLLIDRLGLSKDPLTQLKNITGGLIKSRDEHKAAMEKNQKAVNDFLLKFQGSEDDLKKGLEPLRKAGQDLQKAHHEQVAAAEKAFKQNLNWEQGEKLMKAAAGRHRVMILRHGMPGMMGHGGPGPRAFFFGQQGQQMRKGQMMQGQRNQTNQPPMMGQQPMNPMQARQNQGPKIGPLGHFLMNHLDALDATLAAKLAALGS